MKQCAIIGVLAGSADDGDHQPEGLISAAVRSQDCPVWYWRFCRRDTNVNFYLTLVIAVVVSVL